MTGNYEREQNEPEIVMVNGKEVARQRVECYSRVTGYLRPVSQWNDAKQAEFKERVMFDAENYIKDNE
jgi:hypothetical protein